jgi:hypothetical protein
LFGAESKLVVAALALASAIYQISEGHLLILNPSVRQYCVRRDRVFSDKIFGNTERACIMALQQTHTASLRYRVKREAVATAMVHPLL